MSSSGKRGSGNCPNCKTNYFNRYKPRFCPTCNYVIGGLHIPKAKKPKTTVSPAVSVCQSVISVSTTNRNDQCFVSRNEQGIWTCSQESCKQRRAVVYNSGNTHFRCEHIDKAVDLLSQPQALHRINTDQLMSYTCSTVMRDEICANLGELAVGYGTAPVIQVGDTVFAVYAAASASNPLGFCHVKRNPDNSSITCCGKNCRGIMSKGKQERVRSLCIHVHTLLCALVSMPAPPNPVAPEVNLEKAEIICASAELLLDQFSQFRLTIQGNQH